MSALLMLIGLLSANTSSDWLQEYPRPVDAQCLAGWGDSWAQWPNDSTGGFTCNRIAPPTITLTHREGAN